MHGGGLNALAQCRYEEAAADPDLPIKNRLPEDEREDFKTANQWAEHGCRPKRFAEPVLMRPSKGRKPCRYYRTADVEFIDEDWAKTCLSCSVRQDSYYCPVAGGKIGRNARCSEWELPAVGSTFEGKTVTEVYTGFETDCYRPIDENASNDATNVPWYSRSGDCKSVSVVDSGIKPSSIAFWFHRFKNCISFDVTKLDTSSVSSLEHIFYDCGNVRDLDLSTWDLSHCVTAVSAFAYCRNLESIEFGPISTAVFKPYGCYWMFSDCSNLSLDCSEWIIDPSAANYAFNSGAPGVIPPKAWQ